VIEATGNHHKKPDSLNSYVNRMMDLVGKVAQSLQGMEQRPRNCLIVTDNYRSFNFTNRLPYR
jgi:hypothetical protein